MLPFQKFTLQPNTAIGLSLTALELKDYIDFDVKRIYFSQNFLFKGETSQHCHYVEDELFIIIKGNCTAIIDRGKGIEEIPLTKNEAIYVGHFVWHGFKDVSEDMVLLAVSSTNYNPDRSDYLDNYNKYLKIRDAKLTLAYD